MRRKKNRVYNRGGLEFWPVTRTARYLDHKVVGSSVARQEFQHRMEFLSCTFRSAEFDTVVENFRTIVISLSLLVNSSLFVNIN